MKKTIITNAEAINKNLETLRAGLLAEQKELKNKLESMNNETKRYLVRDANPNSSAEYYHYATIEEAEKEIENYEKQDEIEGNECEYEIYDTVTEQVIE